MATQVECLRPCYRANSTGNVYRIVYGGFRQSQRRLPHRS